MVPTPMKPSVSRSLAAAFFSAPSAEAAPTLGSSNAQAEAAYGTSGFACERRLRVREGPGEQEAGARPGRHHLDLCFLRVRLALLRVAAGRAEHLRGGDVYLVGHFPDAGLAAQRNG